ncbi:MAG: hypothetical protein KC656_09385 [Myxococcales bacterium]|nr:hypothetical protein [Myxococcales bacterium]
MHPILAVALRNQAIYVPDGHPGSAGALGDTTVTLIANLRRLGFTVSEALLEALNGAPATWQAEVLAAVREVRGVDRNWTPLVKGWDVPTGEDRIDHLVTWFVNLVGGRGTTLACGHVIPPGTFPLERYNGCPYCGTPFVHASLDLSGEGHGSTPKVLEVWRTRHAQEHLQALLSAQTPLDATQRESLRGLLGALGLPDAPRIAMKETRVFVIDALVVSGRGDDAQALFASPTDILRYLWSAHTGHAQIVEPRTLIRRSKRNHRSLRGDPELQRAAEQKARADLRLHYTRPMCRQVARWLEGLELSPEVACEIMHPKRRMWVRFIRALRLVELARDARFPRLTALLSTFHSRSYTVHAGEVQRALLAGDSASALRLLEQRPGVFARSLFSCMLHFGPDPVVASFSRVLDRVPARLLFTLHSMAEATFVHGNARIVRPLGGTPKQVPASPLRSRYTREALRAMPSRVEDLCVLAMQRRFARTRTPGAQTMYIDPALFKMPVAIGERSETVQDLPSALMGTRFPVQGDQLRLFLQWGVGLAARHLDMDLSCRVAYPDRQEICAYYALTATGCKHSGDIRAIPDRVGTAEYIELDLAALREAGARYAVFLCNAYSMGGLEPGLVVGWMNSAHPMAISAETGVAYDPSTVQHQVRVTQSLSKGLVFGVLDVAAHEVVWLEIPAAGQLAAQLDIGLVELLLGKLDARLNIGNLLRLKAEAQGLRIVDEPGADEDYTGRWGLDAAAVSALLID